MKKRRARFSRASLAAGFLIAVLAAALAWSNLLEGAEWRSYDLRLSLTARDTPDPRIVLVAIDEKSLAALGRWPWPRETHARLIRALRAAGARVIAFDVEFPEAAPDPAADRELARAAREAGNVVFGAHGELPPRMGAGVMRAQALVPPTPALAAAAGYGHLNMVPDPDGVIRWIPTTLAAGDARVPSLSLAAVSLALGGPPPAWNGRSPALDLHGRAIPLDPAGRFLIRFSGSRRVFPVVSYADALNGGADPAAFRGAIVLVGPWAAGLNDLHTFPVTGSFTPGTLSHAFAMQTLLDGSFVTPAPRRLNLLLVFLFALLPGPLFFRLGPVPGLLSFLLLAGAYAAANTLLLGGRGVLLDLVHPTLGLTLAYLGNLGQRIVAEQRDRLRITGMFQRYVGSQVVKEILAAGEASLRLGGARRPVTVLFLDVRGFTPLAEKLQPEEVVEILNSNFEMITQVIFKYGGTLDKFIGDAVMAVFNSPLDLPDHPLQAVLAAREIQVRAREIRARLEARYGRSVQFGIGINTGEAVCGNIGSSTRMEFTAIGDAVNLAARLESNAKPGQVLISEAVWKAVRDRVATEPVGPITVKGKSEPVNVYAVTIPEGEAPSE